MTVPLIIINLCVVLLVTVHWCMLSEPTHYENGEPRYMSRRDKLVTMVAQWIGFGVVIFIMLILGSGCNRLLIPY